MDAQPGTWAGSLAPRIGVVFPTVAGREDSLERAIRATCRPEAERLDDVQFGLRVYADLTSCGAAWNLGVQELLNAGAEYLLLSADDLEPRDPAWYRPALTACLRGTLPAARLYGADGTEQDTGPPGSPAVFPRVPFLPATLAAEIFPIPPLHYYSDVWIGQVAERHGWGCEYVNGFEFTHHWAQPGRRTDPEPDRRLHEQALAELR